MKNTIEELTARITTKFEGEGTDRYYSALCPICGRSEQANVLSSDSVAKALAISKVTAHLRLSHRSEILVPGDSPATSYEYGGFVEGKGHSILVPAYDALRFRVWANSPDTPASEREKYSLSEVEEVPAANGRKVFFIGKNRTAEEMKNFIRQWCIAGDL